MLKQKSFLSFSLDVLNSVLGFISVYFVARYMGAKPMGIIAIALAFINLFGVLGNLGFGIAHIKRISEGKDYYKCVSTFSFIKIVLTIFMAIIVLAVYKGSESFFDKTPINAKYEMVFYIILASAIIGSLLQIITYTFNAQLFIAKSRTVLLVQKLSLTIAKIVVAISGMSVFYLAGANLFSVLLGIIAAIIIFKGFPLPKFDETIFRSYLKYALPSFTISLASIFLANNIDKILIGYFAGAEEVGYYTAAFSLMMIFTLIGKNINGILFPHYSIMHSENKNSEISILANKVERLLSIPLMPIVFFIFFFSESIIQIIFSAKFERSSAILAIMVLQSLVFILGKPYTTQLVGTNNIKTAMYLDMIIIVMNILLNVLFIPEKLAGITLFGFGAQGSALAFFISTFLGTIMYRLAAYKITGSKLNFHIFLHLILSFVIFIGLHKTATYFDNINLFSLFLYFIIGFSIYVAIMFLMKELDKKDIYYYLALLNIRSMRNYIKNEFNNRG